MAMNLSSGRGGDRFGPSMSDINVTPLVDVILVLLIIFMVTAPMMSRGIDVKLPRTESGSDAQEDRLVVTVDRDSTIFLNDKPVNLALLTDRLKGEMQRTGTDFIFLKADEQVPYGRVMAVMDQIKRAGAEKVGMVTRPSQAPAAPATTKPPAAGAKKPAGTSPGGREKRP
jgi:TolR protein